MPYLVVFSLCHEIHSGSVERLLASGIVVHYIFYGDYFRDGRWVIILLLKIRISCHMVVRGFRGTAGVIFAYILNCYKLGLPESGSWKEESCLGFDSVRL